MIFIVYILFILYAVVFFSSRPKRTALPSKGRIVLYAAALSLLMLGQSYYLVTKPPKVNYYETGWIGLIRYLNVRFAAKGITNQISSPENSQ